MLLPQEPTVIIERPPSFPEFFPPTAPPWETLPPGVVLLIALATVAGTVAILFPLVRALARRIEGGPTGSLRHELGELRSRLAALEAEHASRPDEQGDLQLYQLEERIEFVERLLSRGEAPTK